MGFDTSEWEAQACGHVLGSGAQGLGPASVWELRLDIQTELKAGRGQQGFQTAMRAQGSDEPRSIVLIGGSYSDYTGSLRKRY